MTDEEKKDGQDSEHDEAGTLDAADTGGDVDVGRHTGGDDDGEGTSDIQARESGGARSGASASVEASNKIDALKDRLAVELMGAASGHNDDNDDDVQLDDVDFKHRVDDSMMWVWDPKTGKVRKAKDIKEFAENFGGDRKVAATEIKTKSGTVTVSTVFLGFDHQNSLNNFIPILFETMVFGGQFDGYTRRYAVLPNAKKGHESIVAEVKAGRMRR